MGKIQFPLSYYISMVKLQFNSIKYISMGKFQFNSVKNISMGKFKFNSVKYISMGKFQFNSITYIFMGHFTTNNMTTREQCASLLLVCTFPPKPNQPLFVEQEETKRKTSRYFCEEVSKKRWTNSECVRNWKGFFPTIPYHFSATTV